MLLLRRGRALLREAFKLEFDELISFGAGRGARAGADASPKRFFVFFVFFFFLAATGPGRRSGVIRPGLQEALPSAQQQ